MNRLIVSFSGGRTSAYMTHRILQEWREEYDEINVLFANTGLEHEKTLEFVKECDEQFGFNTVWLEAVTHEEMGKGQTHKIVTFDNCSRNGEPYYDYAAKHGLPNVAAPKCTDCLKLKPIRSYVREVLGHKKRDYKQCVGIRVDEMDRMSSDAMSLGVIYPLVKWNITKENVITWWKKQDFDLEIPEHLGNCVTCFKKSDRKLMTIAKHSPEFFEPMIKMGAELMECGPLYRRTGETRPMFRKNRTAKDIIASSKSNFSEWIPGFDEQIQMSMFEPSELDLSNGCTESCEIEYI